MLRKQFTWWYVYVCIIDGCKHRHEGRSAGRVKPNILAGSSQEAKVYGTYLQDKKDRRVFGQEKKCYESNLLCGAESEISIQDWIQMVHACMAK